MIPALPVLNLRAHRFLVCALVGLAFVTSAWSTAVESDWFTVVGDVSQPSEASKDAVQVNPSSISEASGLRVMQIRANRTENRVSWDGVHYRSFNATVEFDCEKKAARYLSLDYFMQPAWQGPLHKTSIYNRDQIRPMAFSSMVPNPAARIVRAACESKAIVSN